MKYFYFSLLSAILLSCTKTNCPSNSTQTLNIQVATHTLHQLDSLRSLVIETGFAGNSKIIFPAKIDNELYDIRLKGDQHDHYDSKQFSLRIKHANDSLGEVFSVQHPKTRNYINEWIFHELLKENQLAYLEYNFIEVFFNNELQGTYAYEQHLSHNDLLESEGFNLGPILSFDDNNFWKDAPGEERDLDYDSDHYTDSKLRIYNKDEVPTEQVLEAKKLLKSYQLGRKKALQVFNLKKLARFYAICDLNGARHGLRWINLVFHYNPTTQLFSPIGFDSNSGESWAVMRNEKYLNPIHHQKILTEKEFIGFYNAYLKEFSTSEFLDSFLIKHNCKIKNFELLIQKNSPQYNFSEDYLYSNIKKIEKYLGSVQ